VNFFFNLAKNSKLLNFYAKKFFKVLHWDFFVFFLHDKKFSHLSSALFFLIPISIPLNWQMHALGILNWLIVGRHYYFYLAKKNSRVLFWDFILTFLFMAKRRTSQVVVVILKNNLNLNFTALTIDFLKFFTLKWKARDGKF
jgi:hypothetical protein